MTDETPAMQSLRCEAGHNGMCPCNGHPAWGRGGMIEAPAAEPWVPPSKRPNVRLDTQEDGL
jgi:hypothetical protein